jgi:hypothetical protein
MGNADEICVPESKHCSQIVSNLDPEATSYKVWFEYTLYHLLECQVLQLDNNNNRAHFAGSSEKTEFNAK